MTLSTHALDTVNGCPAAGMEIRLLSGSEVLFAGVTDTDGRCPALRELALPAGPFVLTFGVAAYFRKVGMALPDPPFLDVVPIHFTMAEGGHYHVPILAAPFGYSTYRGS